MHVYDFKIGPPVLGSYTVDSFWGRRLTYWFATVCHLGRVYETLNQNAMTSWIYGKADVWVHSRMNKLWIMESCCLKASSWMLESRWASCWSEWFWSCLNLKAEWFSGEGIMHYVFNI